MSKKLLLADDSVTIQKVVGITFAGGEYELAAVGDGDSALEKARAERPDLILADVCMPGKNGYELCAALKKDPALCGIPVLLLTGTFEPFDESKATQAGADGWVAKPFESQKLIKNVEELLARAAETARVEAAVGVENTSQADIPVHDIWADLADSDFSSEAETPVLSKGKDDEITLPDEADTEDIWGGLESEPAPVQGQTVDLATEETETFQDDGFFAAEESDDVSTEFEDFEEGDELYEVGDSDLEFGDDDEILLLSENDIIEDEAFEEEALSSHLAEEKDFGLPLPETLEVPAPEAIIEPEEDVDTAWFQEDPASKSSESETSPASMPHLTEREDEPLSEEEEYEEFSLEGFEDPEIDELDLSEFEIEPDESIEPMGENPSAGGSQEDPFQIGADDFWTAQSNVAESQEDPVWDGKEEPGHMVKSAWEEGAPPAAKLSSVEERAAALSEEDIARIVEKIAGSVIERLAQTMLERIAWEVVPDLAEVMIKEEIRKIREEVK